MKVFACFEPEGSLKERIEKYLGQKVEIIYFQLNEECINMPQKTFFIFTTGIGKREQTSFFTFRQERTRYGIKNNVFMFDLKIEYVGKVSEAEEKKFFEKWKTDWKKFNTKK